MIDIVKCLASQLDDLQDIGLSAKQVCSTFHSIYFLSDFPADIVKCYEFTM